MKLTQKLKKCESYEEAEDLLDNQDHDPVSVLKMLHPDDFETRELFWAIHSRLVSEFSEEQAFEYLEIRL